MARPTKTDATLLLMSMAAALSGASCDSDGPSKAAVANLTARTEWLEQKVRELEDKLEDCENAKKEADEVDGEIDDLKSELEEVKSTAEDVDSRVDDLEVRRRRRRSLDDDE